MPSALATALSSTALADPGCTPCQERAGMATLAAAPTDTLRPFSGVLGVEGEVTGDGRLIEPNALRWERLPLPLRYVAEDNGAHDGAVVVGRITKVWRDDSETPVRIMGAGDIDASTPEGAKAAAAIESQSQDGVSMDLDDVSFEVRVAADLLEDPMAMLGMPPEDIEVETDGDGKVTVMEMNSDDELNVTTSGRLRAATLVAIPAFDSARLSLGTADAETPADDEPQDDDVPNDAGLADDTITASGAPLHPPTAWFRDPGLSEPTALRVTEDGRVYGHLALWNTCHVGHSHNGCVLAPRSSTNYSYFRVGAVLTAEGNEVAVGHITMDTRHASPDMRNPLAVAAHYDHTGSVVADVAAGEDRHGVWVAGALRPDVAPEKVRALRSAPLSGDWRRVGGSLELVAALAVNMPGFPIPRPQGLVASGEVQSLVASGILVPRRVLPPNHPEATLSESDLRYLKAMAHRERSLRIESMASQRRAEKKEQMRQRVLAATGRTS